MFACLLSSDKRVTDKTGVKVTRFCSHVQDCCCYTSEHNTHSQLCVPDGDMRARKTGTYTYVSTQRSSSVNKYAAEVQSLSPNDQYTMTSPCTHVI